MKDITKTWSPSDLAFVELPAVNLKNKNLLVITAVCQTKTGRTWPIPNDPWYQVKVHFINVEYKQIDRIDDGQQVLGFYIDKEKDKYLIGDYEDNDLYFSAKSYTVFDLGPVKQPSCYQNLL